MEDTENSNKTVDTTHLKPYQFKPGESGNPGGRPKGTMKSYLAKKFMEMSEEEKEAFLIEHKVDGKAQIEFGEGKAKQDMEVSGKLSISNVLDQLENGRQETPGQELENPTPIQNQE